ncbi:MAG: HD domain-containing protein [Chloroflexi bacterium OHK40]
MDTTRYDPIWRAALPYLRARKNDVHVPISYGYAVRLCAMHPEADPDVVLPGIILHDVGWAVIDERVIFEQGFGPNMMESAVRRLHEQEGVRIARELLSALDYPAELLDRISVVIDGHDTRKAARSLEDELLKDADKLWRFTTAGIAIACDWFKLTPGQYAARLEREIAGQLFRPWSREIAAADLTASRAALRCDVLP